MQLHADLELSATVSIKPVKTWTANRCSCTDK